MVAIPYCSSTLDEAKEWVRSHITESYTVEPKERKQWGQVPCPFKSSKFRMENEKSVFIFLVKEKPI